MPFKKKPVIPWSTKVSMAPKPFSSSGQQFRSASMPTSKTSGSHSSRSSDGNPPTPSFDDLPSSILATRGRSVSLPSGKGFTILQFSKPPAPGSDLGGEKPRIASPAPNVAGVSTFDLRSARSPESDIFKPASEGLSAPPMTSPSKTSAGDNPKQLNIKFSRTSGFVQEEQEEAANTPDPASGAGSPRPSPHVSPEPGRSNSGSTSSGSRRREERSTREEPNTRVVYINNPDRTNERFEMAGNKIRTSKYTLLSFLPRNLFEQFHRLAYIYFLIIVILNQIPQLAVFGRTASLFPLVFVLVITAVKDAYEDWGRHHSDNVENNRLAQVLQDGHFKPKKWKRIRVGEMLKIYSNETVPCDMVLLGTSDSSGVAYVETMNLDGESNLKSRYARQETASKHPELGPVTGTLICEHPNRNIYEFTAYMDMGGVHLPVGPNNIILRGCEVKNTAWVVGVVVYAGRETKAMLNSSGTQSKRSRLEQMMNRETAWLGLFLLILCFIGGLGNGLWVARHESRLNVIPFYRKRNVDGDDYRYYGTAGEGIIGFLSCIIVFQVMIPISLYISMELVRLGQSYFMSRDMEMFYEPNGTWLQCRALNVNEDLGQIKYLFSDKTGTLTENKMEFHTASIDGVDYSDAKITVDPNGGIETLADEASVLQEVLEKRAWKPKDGAKVDPNLVRLLQNTINERGVVHEYMLVLAACNTVVPTRVSLSNTGEVEMQAASVDEESGLLEYQGESPDEQALVAAAASYGYTLLERTSGAIVIDVLGDIQRFEVLGIHEFDSIRKRMSVVVRCPDGTVKVLVKGADSSMLEIIGGVSGNLTQERHHGEVQLATLGHLDRYAREGLRILVIASKTLDSGTAEKWCLEFSKANTAMVDRVALLRAAATIVENNLTLLGATGIEDKLQRGVPETIALLREAGMKVWVLTGDKQETAISIGFSCLLLTHDMQQIIINETTKEGCKEALANAKLVHGIVPERKKGLLKRQKGVDSVVIVESRPSSPISRESFVGSENGGRNHEAAAPRSKSGLSLALIIDGNSLVHCLTDDLEQELYDVATWCKVVVCCRVAPLQKAGIVSLVKRKAKDMTLAIGDGANDVSMIQMADVGVGISGQEGRQAVMASDFAIGQFRFLQRLLLVHGHLNYVRLGYMVLYNFYRNAVFVMMLFWYILYAAFSPQSALTEWNLVFFSLIYTSVPTIVVGIMDQDVNPKTLVNNPALYTAGQRNAHYNQPLFWATMLDTLWQSLVLFYVPYFSYRVSTVDIWGIGTLWTIAVVILVNIHLAMDIHLWTWITHVAVWCSILATFICVLVMDALTIADLLQHHWDFFHMVGEGRFWFDLFLILVMALMPRFLIISAWQRFFPSDLQIAREAEIKGRDGRRTEQSLELSEVPHSPDQALRVSSTV